MNDKDTAAGGSGWGRLLSRVAPRRATPDDVAHLYRLLLGRDARASEIASCVGEDLLAVVTDLAGSWAHRDFMRSTLDSDVAWLYRTILQREPETDGVVARRAGRPLLDVVLEFVRSEEVRTRARASTAADIEALYRRVLGRRPENDAAVTDRVGLPLLEVAVEIFESSEARAILGIELVELQEWCTLFLGAPAGDEWGRALVEVLRSFRLGRSTLLRHLLRMHLRRRGIPPAHGQGILEAAAAWSMRESPDYRPARHFGSTITLVVPTINSEAWIQSLSDFYDEIGIRPLYAVDSRTTDRTRDILAGAKQNWITVVAPAARVEAMLPGILEHVHTPWVLRLDDDELPSPRLLQCCDDAVNANGAPVWGFPRLCLRWSPDRPTLEYSTFPTLGSPVDMERQWRLFRPDAIRLRDEVHTPGFDSATRTKATDDAVILHFDWILRSPARRAEKAARYEAQMGSRIHPRQILYDAVPDEWHQFEILQHPRSVEFARSIYHRQP